MEAIKQNSKHEPLSINLSDITWNIRH